MYFHGTLTSRLGELIEIHILTHGDRTTTVEIGTEESGIWFAATDAVEITSEVNDTFDHLLCAQASIRLLTGRFIPDFFSADCRDAVVNIYKGGECVFAGFIEPQAYSQEFNSDMDELELSCIDVLTALQYSRYGDVGAAGVSYVLLREHAAQRSFMELLRESLAPLVASLDIKGGGALRLLYDGSKQPAQTAAGTTDIFSAITISELLFLGADEDDVWDRRKVVEEIMRYLNLHIIQQGFTFYIYDWSTVKATPAPITWRDLNTGAANMLNRAKVAISPNNVAGTDASISISGVYNRVSLTCNMENVEAVIESPLSDDALTSPYTNYQLYMTEYSADGEGTTAFWAFMSMLSSSPEPYDEGLVTNWYLQVMDNPNWFFPDYFHGGNDSLISMYCADGTNQQNLPQAMVKRPAAAIFSIGSHEIPFTFDDNAPKAKLDMTNYLCISVNGNNSDDEAKVYPDDDVIKAHIPLAEYRGSTSGGVYSPADDDTVNYIVISGKIIMNPVMEMTASYNEIIEAAASSDLGIAQFWHKTVPSRNNEDGRYYTRRYYDAETPRTSPVTSAANDGFVPFTDHGPQLYEFKYSAVGDSTDTISKVAVLACMLIIGDKCLVETGSDGHVSDFKWVEYKTREQCRDDDEYYSQCFTIGFDPKIGDKLIGTKFDIQNNISFQMGIDAEGTAIPIRKSDRLSGQVRFLILGPVNTVWGEITRRHPTWFRHTKWGQNEVSLLAHTSSIIIEQFEVKVYSDNGLINNMEDNVLIYMSNTHETFTNKKDDIEFRICSALTADERRELGVSDGMSLSTPTDVATGVGVLAIRDIVQNATAKPEQLYVDSYWREYHAPRVILIQHLEDTPSAVGLFNHYTHHSIEGEMFVQSASRNLHEGYAELTLKQIDYD